MKIYPFPKSVIQNENKFIFGSKIICYVKKHSDSDIVLKDLWHNFTHTAGELIIKENNDINENSLYIGKIGDLINLKEFDYAINIAQDFICINSINNKNLMYGFFTLLQTIRTISLTKNEEQFYINCGNIYDKPDLAFRGIHFCVFPETTLEFLRKNIFLCAFYKYSNIIVEFWGMYKYDCYDFLSWENAYTKEQLKPIFDYARLMGVEFIPMINHLGHATQSRSIYARHTILDNDPTKALYFEEDGWTWCVSNPDTLKLLEKLRREMIDLMGDGKYFHVGCDESYSFGTCPLCEKKENHILFEQYINSISKELSKENRQIIIWGDMFLERSKLREGYYANAEYCGIYKSIDNLDKNIVIADWQYEITDETVASSQFFKEKGFECLLSPWVDTKNIDCLIKTSVDLSLKGVLLTTWHTIRENLHIIGYCACAMWDKKNYEKNYSLLCTNSATIMRKLVPANKSYEKAGYGEKEI